MLGYNLACPSSIIPHAHVYNVKKTSYVSIAQAKMWVTNKYNLDKQKKAGGLNCKEYDKLVGLITKKKSVKAEYAKIYTELLNDAIRKNIMIFGDIQAGQLFGNKSTNLTDLTMKQDSTVQDFYFVVQRLDALLKEFSGETLQSLVNKSNGTKKDRESIGEIVSIAENCQNLLNYMKDKKGLQNLLENGTLDGKAGYSVINGDIVNILGAGIGERLQKKAFFKLMKEAQEGIIKPIANFFEKNGFKIASIEDKQQGSDKDSSGQSIKVDTVTTIGIKSKEDGIIIKLEFDFSDKVRLGEPISSGANMELKNSFSYADFFGIEDLYGDS